MFSTKMTDILLDLGILEIDYASIEGWKLPEIVQDEGEDAVHYQELYMEHMEEQPSPFNVLPSSQESVILIPSPHISSHKPVDYINLYPGTRLHRKHYLAAVKLFVVRIYPFAHLVIVLALHYKLLG